MSATWTDAELEAAAKVNDRRAAMSPREYVEHWERMARTSREHIRLRADLDSTHRESAQWRARFEALADDLAIEADARGWRLAGNNFDAYPGSVPASLVDAADRIHALYVAHLRGAP